ncbi:hypothetical protein GCM10009616_06480 [Microlunatus lacustris]
MSDPRQARLLTDPRSAAFIHPFLARERSTAEAAREAGCPLTTMAYRVRVLQEAGLLLATRTLQRAGRPITYCRSSQDAYRVPLTATTFTGQRDQARRIDAPIYRRLNVAYSNALARHGTTTRLITRDDQDGIYSTDQPPLRTANQQPLLFEDRVLHLTQAQAERLCRRLEEELDAVTGDSDSAEPHHSYIVMVAAVPLDT